jgi:AraC family transcriptional regulator, regulatory protein of adaptative response / DNA-3-methyladenine glycosylase II
MSGVNVTTPYDWDGLLRFLHTRSIGAVEHVHEGRYRRSLRAGERAGWIDIGYAAGETELDVKISPSLRGARRAVHALIGHALDTAVDPATIAGVLGELAAETPGLRVPGAFDGFEIAVRAVLGQQITVKAAITLAKRFAERFGEPIETPYPEVTRVFPRPGDVADATVDDIARLGIIGARARTILALSHLMQNGSLELHPGADREATIAVLRSIRGIGEWTADYIAMRALDDPDIFLHGDLGVQKALGHRSPKLAYAAGEAWRPFRSYAVMHLWRRLAH